MHEDEVPPRSAAPDEEQALTEHERFLRELHLARPRTWVTTLLVAVNVGVYLLMLARGVDPLHPGAAELVAWGANYGPLNADGERWRLFTSMFLHFGLVHIGFNMWVLHSVGPYLERMLGHARYLALYLVSGLLASVAGVWWNPDAVSAGASGAIFGVVGGLLGATVARPPEMPASSGALLRKSLVNFVLMNVVLGLAVPQIGLAAHLGGLVAGGACGYLLARGGLPLGRPR